MPRLNPEHLFFGGVWIAMLIGLSLQMTGLHPRVGFWIAMVAFGIGLLPALFGLIFIALPDWWRGNVK
jgi:hypothetical protein